jgi:hypothetical protein
MMLQNLVLDLGGERERSWERDYVFIVLKPFLHFILAQKPSGTAFLNFISENLETFAWKDKSMANCVFCTIDSNENNHA